MEPYCCWLHKYLCLAHSEVKFYVSPMRFKPNLLPDQLKSVCSHQEESDAYST